LISFSFNCLCCKRLGFAGYAPHVQQKAGIAWDGRGRCETKVGDGRTYFVAYGVPTTLHETA
jgi:hypothetical protein